MIYFARKCCQLLTITILAVLITACGSERENTIFSTTTPAAIYAHSVAFRNHTTFTWGINQNGQLGNGDTVADNTQYTPVQVVGVSKVGFLTDISGVSAGGTHSLAFNSAGDIFSWGNNGFGQLGDNSQTVREAPVRVVKDTAGALLTGITAVAAGFSHSLAIDNNQNVWAWGDNQFGQLGDDTISTSLIAVQVSSLSQISKIAAGGGHSLAMNNSQVFSWGYNASGQLGHLDTSNTTLPGVVIVAAGGADLTNVSEIAAGGSHSLFLQNGKVWACGLNNFGQVGNGNTTNQTQGVAPVLKSDGITQLDGVIAIAAGLNHSLAIDGTTGEVWAWGYNFFGQLGNPLNFKTTTAVTSPVKVMINDSTPLTGITKVVAFGHHTLAVDINGKLWVWGDNSFGQLGIADKDTTNRQFATEVTGFDSGAGL